MTLETLINNVAAAGRIVLTRLKDIRTAANYVARALGLASPGQVTPREYLSPTLIQRLVAYLATVNASAFTIRNVQNNILLLLRHAADLGLLTPSMVTPKLMPRGPIERTMGRTSPYRDRIRHAPYRLKFPSWPPALQEGWARYENKKSFKLRPITMMAMRQSLEFPIGYWANIRKEPLQTWEELFCPDRLREFVTWNAALSGVLITTHARQVANYLRAIARALKLRQARALSEYIRDLPIPEPMHDKRAHWIELADLEAVGLALIEDARRPVTSRRNRVRQFGLQRALAFQRSLMLRLLVRIPLRQRNLRECQIEKHLYRDPQGTWHLEFRGRDLKRERGRSGRLNTFRFPFPEDLVPQLEEFLKHYRPLLPNAGTSTTLFMTKNGNPYTRNQLRRELAHAVYQYTGRRVYPHLVRTIWATRCIMATQDYATAAYSLGDTVETVQKRYQELLDEELQQDAKRFVQEELSRRGPILPFIKSTREQHGRRKSAGTKNDTPRTPHPGPEEKPAA